MPLDDSESAGVMPQTVRGRHFLVDNAALARQEMEERGVEFVGPVHHGNPGRAWAHFRGPGGKVFEITQVPEELPSG